MNFDYNEEQQLLADSVRRFLQKDYDFETRRQIVASPDGWSKEVWATFADMGLTGLPLSPDYGGFGGGAVDLMGVMEAFGEVLVVEPYLPTLLGALFLARGGTAAQKNAVLPSVTQGKSRLAFAHIEPGARYDSAQVQTKARDSSGTWILEGEKRLVLGAASAEKLVVSARADSGLAVFLVDAAQAGVTAKHYGTLDEMRAADIVFSGAKAEHL